MSKSYLWVIKILSLRYQKHIWGITYISMRYHKNIWGIRIIQMRDKNHYFLSKAKNFPDLTDLREHDSLNVHVFIYSWLSHSPFRMFGCSILGIQRCRKYTSCSWWWSFEILKAQKQPIATWLHLKGLAILLPQDSAQNRTFAIDWNYFTKYRES